MHVNVCEKRIFKLYGYTSRIILKRMLVRRAVRTCTGLLALNEVLPSYGLVNIGEAGWL
jgi:hypothetical protein